MTIYQIAREYGGIASGGGLGQVVSGIAKSLAKYSNVKSCVFIPLYGFIEKDKFKLILNFSIDLKNKTHVLEAYEYNKDGVEIYLFSFPNVAEKRSIYTYSKKDLEKFPGFEKGSGYIDNDEINVIFQLSVIKFLYIYLRTKGVMILHDAHTALIPAIIKSNPEYLDYFKLDNLLFVIHNAGEIYHQKILYKKIKKTKKIDIKLLKLAKIDKYVDPMYLASLLSKTITVSNYYAKELLDGKHENSDGGFGSFLIKNSIELSGITNGIDPQITNSDYVNSIDEVLYILSEYSTLDSCGEIDNRGARPLFLFQNRITEQKGIDELVECVDVVLSSNREMNFVIMGEGEERYEKSLKSLCNKYNGNIMYIDGYDEFISKSLFACSDFFLITSRWEPCGITDMEASLFMSIPIARETGGLKKIKNGITGYKYREVTDLVKTVLDLTDRYINKYQSILNEKEIGKSEILNKQTWDNVVAHSYIPLFKKMLNE